MLPYFWYMLKVMICSGILFSYYWFFLRNKIFHQYNRFYLLAAMLISLLLPLLKINFWQPFAGQNGAIRVLQAVSAGDEYMNNIVITARKTNWSPEQMYFMGYWLVSIIFFLAMIRTLFLIRSLLKRYPVQQVEAISFVNTNDDSTPFSFFKYIFWNSSIDMNTVPGRQIFKHELAHIQEKHTYDKLFINISLIFCWCNPFFWLYRKELNMIHEFIADKKAVEDSDTSAFAAMILLAAYPKHRFELANHFFYSPIKRRLLMLTKIDNPKISYIARLMVLPLAVFVFAAFTFKVKSIKENYSAPEKRVQVSNHIGSAVASSTIMAEKKLFREIKDTVPGNAPLDPEKALLIVNGKIVGKGKKASDGYNQLVARSVSIKWLQSREAIAKYGNDGADGACEVSYGEGAVFTTTYADADKTSVFYIGIDNPIGVKVQNIQPEDLVVNISEGSISGSNGKYIARFTRAGEVTLTLAKKDGTVLPASFTVKVKGLPEPADPDFLLQLSQKLKLDSDISQLRPMQEQLAKIQQDHAEMQLQYKTTDTAMLLKRKLEQLQLQNLKQKLILEQKSKTKPDNAATELQFRTADIFYEQALTEQKELLAKQNNIVFTKAQSGPMFTGGEEAWKAYLVKNVQAGIPVDEGWKAGKYKVIVKFIVHTDGTVSEVTTENYKGSKTAKHCIDLIKNAPAWQPAVQNGRRVNAYKKQLITFLIEE